MAPPLRSMQRSMASATTWAYSGVPGLNILKRNAKSLYGLPSRCHFSWWRLNKWMDSIAVRLDRARICGHRIETEEPQQSAELLYGVPVFGNLIDCAMPRIPAFHPYSPKIINGAVLIVQPKLGPARRTDIEVACGVFHWVPAHRAKMVCDRGHLAHSD